MVIAYPTTHLRPFVTASQLATPLAVSAPAAPTALALDLVTTETTGVGVTWTDPASEVEPFTIKVQVQAAGYDWTSIQETNVISGVQAAVVGIGVLTPNSAYDVRIRAENAGGESEWVELLSTATRPSAPAPSNLTYDFIETATYTFAGPGGNIGALTYEVESTPPLSWSAPVLSGPNVFVSSATVTDPGSYYVRVRVTNDRGLVSAWPSDMLLTV